MKKYQIFKTEKFEKEFNKLDYSIQERIEDKIEQLEENPPCWKTTRI